MGALRHRTKDRAEVRRMRVHPEYWRCGYGKAVFSAPEYRVTELGYAVLQLDATVNQKAARCLQEKYELREARCDQIHGFACVFYEKSLAEPRPVCSPPRKMKQSVTP